MASILSMEGVRSKLIVDQIKNRSSTTIMWQAAPVLDALFFCNQPVYLKLYFELIDFCFKGLGQLVQVIGIFVYISTIISH